MSPRAASIAATVAALTFSESVLLLPSCVAGLGTVQVYLFGAGHRSA